MWGDSAGKLFDCQSFVPQTFTKICDFYVIVSKLIKGSVPLRPGEKIRKFENQNSVHCLVSMRSSMF